MGPSLSSTTRVPLRDLKVLVLDCQTTGASPQKGHLLEVAWCRTSASQADRLGDDDVVSSVVALPGEETVPRRISRLTGIVPGDLEDAPDPADVWQRLLHDVGEVAGASGATRAPAVAHFARFERSFFEDLCQQTGQPFPLDMVCTHEIACRVLPGLPRRGLRALAGYFGHVLEEHKRAAAHVRASVVVWSRLVELLQSQWQVASLWDLRLFLEEVKATREGGRQYPLARERRLGLPETPGVYHMLGKGGEVLYLGKATSLKSRVNSYFQRPRHDNQRTSEWLTQAYDVAVFPEPSPLEAALREADEIKRLSPPYNVALRQREEAVWFTTDDLDDVSPCADDRHCLGPVPVRGCLTAMGLLRDLLAHTGGEPPLEPAPPALGLPSGPGLDQDCLRQGLELLRATHARWLGSPLCAQSVHRLGAWLWRLRRRQELARDSQQQQEPEQEPRQQPEPAEERGWDPIRVAGALEYAIHRAAQLLRRAHWLCQLSEASLAWEPRTGGRRLLMIQGGQVIRREDLDPGAPLPALPGGPRSLLQRLGQFDPVVHDRLRVLTTELRRLVSSGAQLELRLGPRQVLNLRAVARRLWWF